MNFTGQVAFAGVKKPWLHHKLLLFVSIFGDSMESVQWNVHQMNSQPFTSAEPPHAPAHLDLLRLLESHPEYTQRQIAAALGMSLGKTHYLLKALLVKGSVKVQSFRRSSNKIGYLYRLTPSGVAHRLQLTQRFLTKKEEEYVSLDRQISALRAELASGAKALEPHEPKA